MNYSCMSILELKEALVQNQKKYEEYKALDLKLDMSRGKPCPQQLDVSEDMLACISKNSDCFTDKGFDCRNYGLVDGLDDAKRIFSGIIGVPWENIIVGGNSSLNLMYDAMVRCMLYGVNGGNGPWIKQEKVKFLCPVPGYDRHFAICESLGIEMINIDMTNNGPDMNQVYEQIKDPAVKGIWCVPKYSNPDGITYSDQTVIALANMKPASKDFRIFWDNAYAVHDLYDQTDELLNLYEQCVKAGNPNLPYIFTSTSKITYPGSGVSALGSSADNINYIKSLMQVQTIGHDKMNMLRHVKYFKTANGVKEYMKKHADILRPKFDCVLKTLEKELGSLGIAYWKVPKGGYFIGLNVMDGAAKRTVNLAKEAGVVLTGAGATFPYKHDPNDRNIRIAPSFPSLDELQKAIDIVCVCAKIACLEVLIDKKQ